jgi:hypothetical protein
MTLFNSFDQSGHCTFARVAMVVGTTCAMLLAGCAKNAERDGQGHEARGRIAAGVETSVDEGNMPPPKIQEWMDRLTVDHSYDPGTGFIVAREVISLPPVIAESPRVDEAVRLSRTDGRVVIAIATADRCAPCQQYKKSALNDPRVIEALGDAGLLATHVEVDRNPDLARQYLGGLAIPMTYALVDGERIGTLRGQRSADDLLEWLKEVQDEASRRVLGQETHKWHQARIERLTAADGWLSLVGPGMARRWCEPDRERFRRRGGLRGVRR